MIRNRPSYMVVAALLLGFTWLLLSGELRSVGELIFGILVGVLALWVVPSSSDSSAEAITSADATTPQKKLPTNPVRILRFAFWFAYYIVISNVAMVRAVLASIYSLDHLKQAIISYDTELQGATQISVLANWITLTPGTLTMEISPDGKTLFIHTFNMGESRESFRAEIRTLEQHVVRLFS